MGAKKKKNFLVFSYEKAFSLFENLANVFSCWFAGFHWPK
jgi:hypothetical protein